MRRLSSGRIRAAGTAAVLVVATCATLTASAPLSGGAYPGANGRIAFVSSRDGNQEIYIMRADGREQTNLTRTAVDEDDPAWDPTGRLLAYMRARTGGGGGIWLQQVGDQGRNDVTLTSNPMEFTGNSTVAGSLDQGPSWTPLGIEPLLVFESDRAGVSELYWANHGGQLQRITRLTSNGASSDRSPAWSPLGDKIAFWSARDQQREIYVMSTDGTNQTNLTRNNLSDRDPSWSPDGKKIAFERSIEGSNSEIFVMNADGSGVENLSGNPADEFEPAWSPDGESIAFVSDRDGNDEIYTMKADGTNQTRVTTNTSSDRRPDWQPLPSTTGVLNLLGMSKETKDSLKAGAKISFGSALAFCPILLIPGAGQVFASGFAGACAGFIAQLIAAGVLVVVDPPDPRFGAVAMPSSFAAPKVGNSVCRIVRGGVPCSRLKVAMIGFGTADGRAASIAEAMAITANRASGARNAASNPGMTLQRAAARTYWGAYAFALRDRAAAAKRLAREFQRARIDVTVTPQQQRQGVSALSQLTGVPDSLVARFNRNGFSRDDVKAALAGALQLFPLDTRPRSLRAILNENAKTAGMDRDYRRITLDDVRAILDSLRAQGIVTAATASALSSRLTRARTASRRRAEMRAFVALVQQRVKRQPHSAFLQVAAAPLAGLNQGLGRGTPARVSRTKAVATVRAILNRNARRCRLAIQSISARTTTQGWQVTALVRIRGGTPSAASWNVVGSRVAAADPLAAEIARGCP